MAGGKDSGKDSGKTGKAPRKPIKKINVAVRTSQIDVSWIENSPDVAKNLRADQVLPLEERIAPSVIGGPGLGDGSLDPTAGDPQPGDDYSNPNPDPPPPPPPPEPPPPTGP